MIDIGKLMTELARDRPLFHSEADFQHALGWQIQRANPEYAVRFEYKPRPNLAMYADLWLATVGVVVELKYRTRSLNCEVGGEAFHLRDQRAHPPSRYSFLKDLQRLEEFVRTVKKVRAGLAVFLTNDPAYWKVTSGRQVVDADFRIHEGRQLAGEMVWSERTSPGTKEGSEDPIRLAGEYRVGWRDYASVGTERHAVFRYLAIQVGNGI
ncbi:MAG: hypothetical protein OXQ89_03050 [Rhodospirillaceae bacterium]|nr:hypothetical protein [Rhodospirillaceae bacterium]